MFRGNIYTIRASVQKHGTAQQVWPFGMNPKVGGLSPIQVETFSVSKNFDTFTRTPVLVSKMNAVARA